MIETSQNWFSFLLDIRNKKLVQLLRTLLSACKPKRQKVYPKSVTYFFPIYFLFKALHNKTELQEKKCCQTETVFEISVWISPPSTLNVATSTVTQLRSTERLMAAVTILATLLKVRICVLFIH